MSKRQLHVPIALKKVTNELVNVKDVPNGLGCECYCANCRQDLIAVNKEIKQKAHFRHDMGSDCQFNSNYESYIHWLSKEVFSQCTRIKLPPIYFNELPGYTKHHQKFTDKLKNLLKAQQIINEFPENHFNFANICLQETQEVQVTKVEVGSVF